MGTEVDDTQLRRFVVQVQTADAHCPLGTGVLVAPVWALTCAHVSASADRLADLARDYGRGREALAIFESAMAIDQRKTELEPGNTTYRRDLSISYERLGVLAAGAGQQVAAHRYLMIALAARRGLRRQEPERADFAEELGVTLYLIANTVGDPREARHEVVEILVSFEQAGTLTPKGAALLTWARSE